MCIQFLKIDSSKGIPFFFLSFSCGLDVAASRGYTYMYMDGYICICIIFFACSAILSIAEMGARSLVVWCGMEEEEVPL